MVCELNSNKPACLLPTRICFDSPSRWSFFSSELSLAGTMYSKHNLALKKESSNAFSNVKLNHKQTKSLSLYELVCREDRQPPRASSHGRQLELFCELPLPQPQSGWVSQRDYQGLSVVACPLREIVLYYVILAPSFNPKGEGAKSGEATCRGASPKTLSPRETPLGFKTLSFNHGTPRHASS